MTDLTWTNDTRNLARRAALADKVGTWNTMRLQEIIAEIEAEKFENQAGYLSNFIPWHELKDILGFLAETVANE